MSSHLTLRWMLLCIVASCIGCDSLIYQAVSVETPDLQVEWPETRDSNRYRWPLDGRRYIVTKPPPLAYLSSFGKQFAIDEKVNASAVAWDDLELGDTAESFMRHIYGDNDAPWEPHLEIPTDQLQSDLCFDLSANGKRLVLLEEDKLVLYNAETGERMGALDLPGEWQNGPPSAVRFCGANADMLVGSPEQICRISSKTGQIIARTAGCSEPIKEWQVDNGDTVTAILTESGKVFTGDSKLNHFGDAKLGGGAYSDIALTHDGRRVLLAGGPHPYWGIIEDGRVLDESSYQDIQFDGASKAIRGWDTCGWLDKTHIVFMSKQSDQSGTLQNVFGQIDMLWRPHLAVPYSLTLNSRNTLLVVARQLVDEKLHWILFDLGANSRNFSPPVRLKMRPRKLLTSHSGKTVVLLDDDGLHLFIREPWAMSSALRWTRFHKIIKQEPMRQLELLYEAIGRQQKRSMGAWPSEYQRDLIDTAADIWQELVTKSDPLTEKESHGLKKLEQWHAEGGMLARTVRGELEQSLAWDARGNGLANTVSQEGWELFEKHNRRAVEILSELVKNNEKPPSSAFLALIQATLDLGGEFADVDAYAKQFTELYPENLSVANLFVIKLLPQWGGEPGDMISLIDAQSRLYTGDYADIAYSELIGRIASNWGNERQLDVKSVSVDRLLDGMRANLNQEQPLSQNTWYLRNLMDFVGTSDSRKEATRMIMESHALIPNHYEHPMWINYELRLIPNELFDEALAKEPPENR